MAPAHPFFEGLTPTLHIAHRGGALLYPENTLFAFEQAVTRHHTQMIETDVQLTRDGVVVVAHDDTVDRCTDGHGDVRDLTFADLQKLDAGYRFTPDGGKTFPYRGQGIRISTLEEALARFPKLRFNIEVKRPLPGFEAAFAKVLQKADALDRVCIGAMEDALGARLYSALPDACHFYPKDALTAFVLQVRSGEAPPMDPRYLVLDMPLEYAGMRLIDAEFVKVVEREKKWVNVWTVDDPKEMRQLVSERVGGIMTDRPDVLRDVLDGK